MRYDLGQFSLTGDRSMNQDRCAALETPRAVFMVLGDGMGGHPGGDKAAEILVNTCHALFQRSAKPTAAPDQLLERMFQQAHDSVVSYGLAQQPPIEPRTTAVMALIQGEWAYWAHSGDSRLYLLRAGEVLLRTQDHSYVEELYQRGEISADERDGHPYRHYVTRAVGGLEGSPRPALGIPTRLEPGDLILLCSDGLWAQLPEATMARALADGSQPLETVIGDLVHRAMMQGHPFSDNVTAIALRWLGAQQTRTARTATATHSGRPDDQMQDAIDNIKRALADHENEEDKE